MSNDKMEAQFEVDSFSCSNEDLMVKFRSVLN